MSEGFNLGVFLTGNSSPVQELIQKTQGELAKIYVSGECVAGLVQVVVNGIHETVKVKLADELFNGFTHENQSGNNYTKEDIEELIKAAINYATRKAEFFLNAA